MNRRISEVGCGTDAAPGQRSPRFAGAWLRTSLFALAATAVTTLAFAAEDSRIIFPSGGKPAASPAAGGTGTANLLTLVVALAIAVVGGWYYWRNRKASSVTREGRALAIDETRSLGNRQYLVVASYEGKKFLLGVCPGRIDMLAPLTDGRRDEGPSR